MPIPVTLAPVMKSLFPRLAATSLEPLEARIAPARVILAGSPNALGFDDVDYTDANAAQQFFVDTETGIALNDQISTAVGGGILGDADTFYIKLFAGDVLKVFNTTNSFESFIEVKQGNLLAFFVDKDSDNEVDEGELTGLSLGKNVVAFLNTSVEGDIVTNLNEQGTVETQDDTLDMGGLISATQGIKSLTVGGGNVGGSIIAGGKIKNVAIAGNVENILAGSAVNNTDANTNANFPVLDGTPDGIADGFTSIDFFPGVLGGNGNLSFAPGAGVKGAPIGLVDIASVDGRIEAGSGGEGAKGGAVTAVEIVADADGARVLGGAGGDAGLVKKAGGAGGKVQKVTYSAPDAGDLSANSLIEIRGGPGGDATTGKAGNGGSVGEVLIGFKLIGGKPFGTAQLVQDNVTLAGGAGGAAKVGGKGGDVFNSIVQTVTPDIAGDELLVLGGAGGNSTALLGGKTGAGGSIREVSVLNQRVGVAGGALIEAGDAGNGAGADRGSAGGDISKLRVLATEIKVFAGNGSAGNVGGNGGNVEGVDIDTVQGIFARNATINAGFGGKGAAGKGGNGGNMGGVRVDNGDFTTLNLNEGAFGDGGDSALGKGGKGGRIERVDIFEADFGTGANGVFTMRTGNGGDGTTGGGSGGVAQSVRFAGFGMDANVLLGAGGDVLGAGAKGKGGKGGGANSVEIQADGTTNSVPARATVLGGEGGDGAGAGGVGGNGGGFADVSLRSEGAVRLEAGDGGNGTTGKAGDGGTIRTSGGFANISIGTLIAGDAGVQGAKPADGGSIIGRPAKLAGLYAQTDVTVQAGDGSHGGSGGSLSYVGYGSTSATLVPTPVGTITIEAGDGSSDGTAAGNGGSIRFVSGAISSGAGMMTLIRAGNGGSAFAEVPVATVLDGNGAQAEIQVIDLASLADTPRATFVLTYANGATVPLPVVPSAVQTPANFADQIEVALNQLAGIGAGGVDVTPVLDGGGAYTNQLLVSFAAVGPRDQLAGQATLGTAAGAGGSIDNLIVERGGAEDGVTVIEAGHGGDTPGARGAKGGSVTNVSVAGIDDLAILRSIAAGDGGDGVNAGAPGGSIANVDVLGHDIGVRVGADYGYATMGGLFAGAGGIATRNGASATSGSVTEITAQSIAAIVAGRAAVPQAANVVGQIYLEGFDAIKDSTGGILHAFPNTSVVATFNGESSLPIPGPVLPDTPPMPANDGPLGDTLLDDVEDILNAMSTVQSVGGVRVTGGFYTGYQVTFVNNGDQTLEFTAAEFFPLAPVEVVPGTSPLPTVVEREGDDQPPASEIQSFTIDPTAFFNLSFGGVAIAAPLPPTATETDVAVALNALPTIDPNQGGTGPVTVAKDPVNDRFIVTFAPAFDQFNVLVATAERNEVQSLDFYALGNLQFTFEGESTIHDPAPGNPPPPFVIPHDATPLEVQNALNSLTSIQATGPGGVGGAVSVTAGPNGAYLIEFNTLGDKTEITGTQHSGVPVNVTNGTALTPEVQIIAPPVRTLYNPATLAVANYVGGVADPLSLQGPVFRFADFVTPDLVTDPADSLFEPEKGDRPLDGLIMSRTYLQKETNFIPEARHTGGTFFDFDNRI